jgi:hypothetical protein
MQGFKLAAVLAVGVALALAPAAAMAAGEREARDDADLTTSQRTCHVSLTLLTADASLVNGLPATNSSVRTLTSVACDYLSLSPTPVLTSGVTTDEYLVEAAPRTVMTQNCIANPATVNYCTTDGTYAFGLQGVRYQADAAFVIRLPLGETFTGTPPQCTLTATSGRTAACRLTGSVVTHAATLG